MTLDRYGEPTEGVVTSTAPSGGHDPRCRRGWLGEDLDGRPVPCLICRPHLAQTVQLGVTR